MKKGILLSIVLSSILFANSIEAGYKDYFVTDANGTSYGWGYNDYGDLGIGSGSYNKSLPTKLDTNLTFKDISSLYKHVLALRKDGKVYAWGYNYYGQLGDGTTSTKYSPELININDTIIQVSAGNEHSLALSKDGKIYAWGYNNYGQLGDGTTSTKHSPELININDTIIQVSAGNKHSLALSKDGKIYAWGYNYYGQLGDGTTSTKHSPELIDINDTIIQVSAGNEHSLALSKDGKIYAWGYNYYGQLGDGTTSTKHSPELIDINDTIIKISAGGYHNLVLSKDGKVYAWGDNYYGQLGDGSSGYLNKKTKPTEIKFPAKIVDIDAGEDSSIAIDENGWVYAWGYHAYNGKSYYKPTKVMNINPVNIVVKNKKFFFLDNPNTDENNQYIVVVNVDNNDSVSMKEYYLDGTLKVSFDSNLTTVDQHKAYFIAGNTKYWLLLDGPDIKMYKTGKLQTFSDENSVSIKETALDDKNLIKKYGYRLHTLDTSINISDNVLKMYKNDNNLTVISNNSNTITLNIYDISNPYVPELKQSLTGEIKSDLISGSVNIYKAIKKGNSFYVAGYYYGYQNETDKKNNQNKNKYVFITKFDITSNGLTQKTFKVLDRKCDYNFKLGFDSNYVYLLAAVYDKDGNSKERLYVFDDDLNVINSGFDLKGYYYDYYGDIIVKDKKIYVAYKSGVKIKEIDVSDLNYITENSIGYNSNVCCNNAEYLIKDNNGTVYLQTEYSGIIKLDENMKSKNKYDLSNVKAIHNNLAITNNGLYRLNDNNTTTLLSSSNSISNLKNLLFVDNEKFYGYNSNNKEIQLGSIKAYDRDFDGVYDYEDVYPDDPTQYFIDNDKDGLADTLNPNTAFNDPIYDNVKFDPDYFNLEVNLTNPIVGSESKTNGILNVSLENNGSFYSLDNSLVNVNVLNDPLQKSYYDNYYYNSMLEYKNNQLYPSKDSIALLEINTTKLPEKDYIDSYVLLNTNNKQNLSDTAKELNTSDKLSANQTYTGDIYYDADVKNSNFTWLKIVNTSNENTSSYTKYKFILNGEKYLGDNNASVTMKIYSEKSLNFQVLSGNYVYKDKWGSVYYVDKEGIKHSLYKDSNGNYYYSDGEQYVCDDYGYCSYEDTKVSIDVDNKLLKEGYYTDGNYQYYVDDNGKRYKLSFDSSKGEYYYSYYDKNDKYNTKYITPDLEPIGEKTYKLSKLIMTDLVVDNTKNYYIELLTNEYVSDYKFDLALIKDNSYYNNKITLDANGTGMVDLVVPKSKTYKLILNSDDKFDANLTDYENEKRVKDKLVNEAYAYKNDLGLKAGLYSLYFKGKPNSSVKYILMDSGKVIEQEPDNTIDTATKYIPNKEIQGNIANANDVDYYAFYLGKDYYWYDSSNKYTFNITLKSDDVNKSDDGFITLYLYNTVDPLAMASKKVYFSDFENGSVTTSFTGNFPAGVYYLKVKYNTGEKYPFNYSLSIGGSIQELPNTNIENLYTEQYYKYMASNSLDLDKIEEQTVVKGDRGEAIILAGIGDDPTDPLFKPTQTLAYNMYRTFKLRGFSDKDITFMDSYTDADGDGKVDDFNDDSNVTVKDFYNAIENAKKSNKKGPLYIYMVDHGANGAFKISANDVDGDGNPEIVYAKDLTEKLDDFQKETGRKVVLIIEACKSGSFIDKLQSTIYDRAVITSSKKGEISFIDPSGVSFSKFLQYNLLAGRDIEDAYKFAKNQLYKANPLYINQHPQLYKTNDEIADIVIGGNFAAAGMELTKITDYYGKDGNETIDLSNTNQLNLYAVVKSASPIKKVYAVVIPPSYKPEVSDNNFSTPDLSKYTVSLTYNKDDQRYEGSFDLTNYKYNGIFSISYVAEDSDENVITESAEINATGGKDVPKEGKEINQIVTTEVNETNNTNEINNTVINIEINQTKSENNSTDKNDTLPPEGNDNSSVAVPVCADVMTWACNIKTGEEEVFSSSCIPDGWTTDSSKCPSSSLDNNNSGVGPVTGGPVTEEMNIYTYHINSGWNMVGALTDIDVADISANYSKLFTMPDVIAWKWDNTDKSWSVYTDMNVSTNNYSVFDYINKGEGFWVKVNSPLDLTFTNVTSDDEAKNYSSGWNLIAVMKDENASDVISQTSGDILWQYDTLTNKWKVYTQDSELKVLLQPYYDKGIFEKLDTLKKGSAVWVYIK